MPTDPTVRVDITAVGEQARQRREVAAKERARVTRKARRKRAIDKATEVFFILLFCALLGSAILWLIVQMWRGILGG